MLPLTLWKFIVLILLVNCLEHSHGQTTEPPSNEGHTESITASVLSTPTLDLPSGDTTSDSSIKADASPEAPTPSLTQANLLKLLSNQSAENSSPPSPSYYDNMDLPPPPSHWDGPIKESNDKTAESPPSPSYSDDSISEFDDDNSGGFPPSPSDQDNSISDSGHNFDGSPSYLDNSISKINDISNDLSPLPSQPDNSISSPSYSDDSISQDDDTSDDFHHSPSYHDNSISHFDDKSDASSYSPSHSDDSNSQFNDNSDASPSPSNLDDSVSQPDDHFPSHLDDSFSQFDNAPGYFPSSPYPSYMPFNPPQYPFPSHHIHPGGVLNDEFDDEMGFSMGGPEINSQMSLFQPPMMGPPQRWSLLLCDCADTLITTPSSKAITIIIKIALHIPILRRFMPLIRLPFQILLKGYKFSECMFTCYAWRLFKIHLWIAAWIPYTEPCKFYEYIVGDMMHLIQDAIKRGGSFCGFEAPMIPTVEGINQHLDYNPSYEYSHQGQMNGMGGISHQMNWPIDGIGQQMNWPTGGMGQQMNWPMGGMNQQQQQINGPMGGMGQQMNWPMGGMNQHQQINGPIGGMRQHVHGPMGGISQHMDEGERYPFNPSGMHATNQNMVHEGMHQKGWSNDEKSIDEGTSDAMNQHSNDQDGNEGNQHSHDKGIDNGYQQNDSGVWTTHQRVV